MSSSVPQRLQNCGPLSLSWVWLDIWPRGKVLGLGNELRMPSINSSPQNASCWEQSLGKYLGSSETHRCGHCSPSSLLSLRPLSSTCSAWPCTGCPWAVQGQRGGFFCVCHQGACSEGESFMRRIVSCHTHARNLGMNSKIWK